MRHKQLFFWGLIILTCILSNNFACNFFLINNQNKSAELFKLDLMRTVLQRRDYMVEYFNLFHSNNVRSLLFTYYFDLKMLELFNQLNSSKERIFKGKDVIKDLEFSFQVLEQFFPCCNYQVNVRASKSAVVLMESSSSKYSKLDAFLILSNTYKAKIICLFDMIEDEDDFRKVLLSRSYCGIRF